MPRHDDIPEKALAWHRAGKGAVLATVIETWGSAPRRAGSQMVVSGQGDFAGSVSGGCVEGEVVLEAAEALVQGAARVLSYGVAEDTALALGLACGGTIRILLEPVGPSMPLPALEALVQARASRTAVAYVADTAGGPGKCLAPGDGAAAPLVAECLRRDRPQQHQNRIFVPFAPPLRLLVVGAVHIAQPLLEMAATLGYDSTLIDPRTAFANPQRFPGVPIQDSWPDQAIAALRPDARTAVAALTHDPKLDDPALRAALDSAAFYIGALGSTRSHEKRLKRLHASGLTRDQTDRIHGPIGLAIGAATPAEIALSIAAQMTSCLRQAAENPAEPSQRAPTAP